MKAAHTRAPSLAVFGCVVLGVLGGLLALGSGLVYYLQSPAAPSSLPSPDVVVNTAVLIGLGAVGILVPAVAALVFLRARQRWAVVGAMVGAAAVAAAVLGLLVVDDW